MTQQVADLLLAESGKSSSSAMPWLVVFDLDGTLIDSSRDLVFSVNQTLRLSGAGVLPAEQIGSFIGDGAAALVSRSLIAATGQIATGEQSSPVFREAFQCFLDTYRKHKLDHTEPYPGVLASLSALRKRQPDLLMAVLTNKPVRPSREICESLGLAPFFFANYGGDSFATKKPDPAGLLTILDEARRRRIAAGDDPSLLVAENSYMVGDSPVDVMTARGAAMRTVGCSYGLSPETLRAAKPDLMVSSPEGWLAALTAYPSQALG